MTLLGFILAYLLFELFMPLIDKSCEFLVNLIHLGVAKISLKLTEIQKRINDISTQEPMSTSHPIGFQLPEEDYIKEEVDYENRTE